MLTQNLKIMIKKILLLFAIALCIIGCSKQKPELKALLTETMRNDKDQQDYKLSPEEMAGCVLKEIDKGIPKLLFGPKRDGYYLAYSRYLKSKDSAEVLTVFKEAEQVFGSVKDARKSFLSVSDHVMTCMGVLLANKN